MIYAIALTGQDGLFYVSSDRSTETYYRKNAFKSAGATWDGQHWHVTDKQRRALGIERKVVVTVAHSDGDHAQSELVLESKAIVGDAVSAFCEQCDGRTTMTILAVIEEAA